MLPIRVNEVLSRAKEFADAGRVITRPLTSTVNILVHPVETITGFADGVARLCDRIKLGSERVYEDATAPGQSGGERATDASKAWAQPSSPRWSDGPPWQAASQRSRPSPPPRGSGLS